MVTKFLIKFFLLWLFIVFNASAELHISCGFRAPQTTFYQAVISEALSRINLKLKFHELPAERSIQMVNAGVMDGECSRVPKAVANYKNLIKVPEKIWDIKFTSFVMSDSIKIKAWQDLKPYHVATVAGFKMAENIIPNINPKSFIVLPNVSALFKMLEAGRIDVAVLTELTGKTKLKELNIRGVYIQKPPLAAVPLYLMLYKKHAALVDPLRKIFSEMKEEGVWQDIYNKVFTTN